MTTVYTQEYLTKFDVREKIFQDRDKALCFARDLRTQGFIVKTTKFDDGREDWWQVEAKKSK